MKNLAIIPARGGSKRIPRKNIKDFLGKPIIAYSIEIALKSELFDEVMVSTDDAEIADVALKYGANVPFMRSKENADDFASTSDVLIEVVSIYKTIQLTFENLCCIYPTSPLISSKKLNEAYSKFLNENLSSLFPVVKYSYPPQRGLKFCNNRIKMLNDEYMNTRSQDLEAIYHDAGQFYFLKTDVLIKEKKLFCENSGAVILSELEVQDIDNETDWNLAEIKYKLLNG